MSGRTFLSESIKKPLSGLLRRPGVLSRNQQAVLDNMHAPIGGRRKLGSLLFQHVLEQVRNNIDQLHGGFFRVCEPSDRPALRDRLAVRCLHVRENPRRVSHESDRLPRSEHIFDERQCVAIVCQVPERAVATWEEHAVVVRMVDVG